MPFGSPVFAMAAARLCHVEYGVKVLNKDCAAAAWAHDFADHVEFHTDTASASTRSPRSYQFRLSHTTVFVIVGGYACSKSVRCP